MKGHMTVMTNNPHHHFLLIGEPNSSVEEKEDKGVAPPTNRRPGSVPSHLHWSLMWSCVLNTVRCSQGSAGPGGDPGSGGSPDPRGGLVVPMEVRVLEAVLVLE